ncbi:hypothetical protein [Gimesia panareensis]|uniref:hypothetical protein n=1 Tax=Gimesia panareensis TaxID=2527978 RepID=UPI0011895484|nr:hypothetical protein [Gimesia panareensis]QDU50865.1 hypothetical protein Pan110_32260 [Gimesia panareensis]
MSEQKPTCFIIMPITTPDIYQERYKDDPDHFQHVLECLFKPAVEEAGFRAIPPIAEGAENIPAKIIETLTDCDLVLCDMSILNANVFFELGVRTALDKPVALTADRKTKEAPPGIPFDISSLNFHAYDSSLAAYDTKIEIPKLAEHIQKCAETSDGRNTLWKYYGISQTGRLNPEDASIPNKLDLILDENISLRSDISGIKRDLNRVLSQSNATKQAEDWTSSAAESSYLMNYKKNLNKKITNYVSKKDLESIRNCIQFSISKMGSPINQNRVFSSLENLFPELIESIPEQLIRREIDDVIDVTQPDLSEVKE